MPISTNLAAMIRLLPTIKHPHTGDLVVEHFAMLIEMHQDNDNAYAQFRHSFIRGQCAPIKVSYCPATFELENEDGTAVDLRYREHRFLAIEDWSRFAMNYIMDNGVSPLIDGTMPTRLLRDARAGRNELRSFRQMVIYNYTKHQAAGTLVKP